MSKQQASGGQKVKPKRLSIRRTRTRSPDGRHDGLAEEASSLPPEARTRLWNLFAQIEREFEGVHAENCALRERVEKLEIILSGEKGVEGDMVVDGMPVKPGYGKKPSASQLMSQKLKTTYKASTSKIVSSFKIPNQAAGSVECHRLRGYLGHRDGVWEVSYARHGQAIIATASADRSARLWDVDSGLCLLKYLGHIGSVNSIRFHPTEPLVCTASGEGTCHVWRANVSIPEPRSLPGSADEADAAVSDHEDVEGADNPDAPTPAILRSATLELKGHEGSLSAADWFTSGKQIVTASWDRTAKLWDVETGEQVHSLTVLNTKARYKTVLPLEASAHLSINRRGVRIKFKMAARVKYKTQRGEVLKHFLMYKNANSTF